MSNYPLVCGERTVLWTLVLTMALSLERMRLAALSSSSSSKPGLCFNLPGGCDWEGTHDIEWANIRGKP